MADAPHGVTLPLAYSPPYAWEHMLAFWEKRAIAGVEAVVGNTYARSISTEGHDGVLVVSPGRVGELVLRIHGVPAESVASIERRVRRLFDFDADPHAIDAHLGDDPLLAPLIAARPGLRVAGAWDGFELAVRAILGQQITVSAARGLAAKLVARLGRPLGSAVNQRVPGVTHLFPTAAAFAGLDASSLGMPRARASALISLASACDDRPALLDRRGSLDESVAALRALPGIGEWTAQYIAMRAQRWPDAFPSADVALLRAMQRLSGTRLSSRELVEYAERWRPWRSYGATHLWASLAS